ncbi:undecaprenyl-diphosphate phosphatase [Salinarimonas sp.]|uniref:undecaprenyl-diphosphate phosphatase n=1 Tax=Salinarimonas sp. TaxID=2766526 RepID=UPI00391C621C
MTLLEAALLGIVQGVFMFVPVSSTAHLVATQHLLIASGSQIPPPESPQMIFFDLVVHVGTLVSVVWVFRLQIAQFLSGTATELRRLAKREIRGETAPRQSWFVLRLWMLGLLSVFVTGTMGLAFRDLFKTVFATPAMLAATFTITGILLYVTDRLPPRRLGIKDIGPAMALAIGFAQGLALIPGLSRSGLTIIAALLCGLKRKRAAEYSFFIAFPTILAATAVQAAGLARAGEPLAIAAAPLAVAFVVSALVGVVALKLVLALLYRARLRYFSYYLWALALLVLVGFGDVLT